MAEDIETVTKLDAAHRQIRTAIRMYFAGDDMVSIHTLACAAREIYEKHCQSAGNDRMFNYIQASHPDLSEKELWNIINSARNFFKHPDPDGDLNAFIQINDASNKAMLFCACHDCAMLCGSDQPAEVQAFNVWFMATEIPCLNNDPHQEDIDAANKIQGLLSRQFPGLREASLEAQREMGKQLLQEVICGNLVTLPVRPKLAGN
ncbi:MAG TPA: hypothetical protein VNX00_06540 [Herbaspirillum sp.]|nr:hypothetical protein [Herbaspirillum sp.]